MLMRPELCQRNRLTNDFSICLTGTWVAVEVLYKKSIVLCFILSCLHDSKVGKNYIWRIGHSIVWFFANGGDVMKSNKLLHCSQIEFETLLLLFVAQFNICCEFRNKKNWLIRRLRISLQTTDVLNLISTANAACIGVSVPVHAVDILFSSHNGPAAIYSVTIIWILCTQLSDERSVEKNIH